MHNISIEIQKHKKTLQREYRFLLTHGGKREIYLSFKWSEKIKRICITFDLWYERDMGKNQGIQLLIGYSWLLWI